MTYRPARPTRALRCAVNRRTAVVAALAALGLAAPADAAKAPVQVSATPIEKALTTKAATARITVKNTGKRRLSGLTLSLRSVKGVTVKLAGAKKGRLSRKLAPLKGGKSARVKLTVRRGKKGPTSGRLTLRVLRGGKTLATGRLTFGPPAPQTAPTPTPAPAPPPPPPVTLTGRYFWGSTYTINGIDQRRLIFTGPDLVFTGATDGAWPTCVAVSEDCKAYSYDPATNQLVIDGKPATLEGRKLTLDGDGYSELGRPPAGSRWDTVVTYSNSSGLCPLYCNYYTEYLTFRPDGTFARDAVASGSGPIVDWSSIPPDRKGTYEVRADATLRLAYEDGTERIDTIALYLADDGSLQPAGAGMILDGDGYFDIRD